MDLTGFIITGITMIVSFVIGKYFNKLTFDSKLFSEALELFIDSFEQVEKISLRDTPSRVKMEMATEIVTNKLNKKKISKLNKMVKGPIGQFVFDLGRTFLIKRITK